jgi:broad specificity phosphatase PhoE
MRPRLHGELDSGTRVPRVEVVVVRHGETEWSRTGRHTGRSDPPLTEEGERQARAVGEALRGRSFALVLSSPLLRALETASLAGFEPELRDDLAEWDYGEYDGMTTPEIREQVPDWTIWRYGGLGGESVEQLAARADRVVAELLQVEGDVLVFSHGHFLRVLTARWLELAAADGRLFALDSGTLSALGFERDQRVIRAWNVPVSG